MAATSFMFLVLSGAFSSLTSANICEKDASSCVEISLPPPSCDDKNWDAPLRSCIMSELKKCSNTDRLIKSKRRLEFLQLLKQDYCSNSDYRRDLGSTNLNCWRGVSTCLLGIFTTILPDETTKRDPQSDECQTFLASLKLCQTSVKTACRSVEAVAEKFIDGTVKHSCCGEQKVPNCNRCNAPRCVVNTSLNTSLKKTIHILVIVGAMTLLLFM